MQEVTKLSGVTAYCEHINIRRPRYDWFDVQRFEDNMPTVKRKVLPFRHDLFAVGLLVSGTSNTWNGIDQMQADLIFNSPYQLISWDIVADWAGYYVVFNQEFINRCSFGNNFLNRFNFFQLDKNSPITVEDINKEYIYQIFSKIYQEHQQPQEDSFAIIEALIHTLLVYTKRAFNQKKINTVGVVENNLSYHQLFSQFQSALEAAFFQTPEKLYHSASYYGQQLHVHPNYLNSIVKKVSGQTTKQYVDSHIGRLAQKLLLQSDLPVKEVGYELGFEEPSHFNNFFKKHFGLTPTQYRKQTSL